MAGSRSNDRLVALFIVGVLALNYPLLHLFGKGAFVFGLPVVYLYLFLVWMVIIVCLALVLERRPAGDRELSSSASTDR
ncbi:MAG: hypothetical protein Kow006_32470 [Gammaproteobacteria bacterium]